MEISHPRLSIIVLAGNEAEVIEDCLKSCLFADELIVVLANSSDTTKEIIRDLFPETKIIVTADEYNKNFSKWRNLGLSSAAGDWILYVDADERVTQNLKDEIIQTIQESGAFAYYVIPRFNYFLGKRVKYGGTYPDYVKRLFRRFCFSGFEGILHEEPKVTGDLGYLKSALTHLTHRYLETMVDKTLSWTEIQAKHLYESKHPPLFWWRFPRMFFWKFWRRLIKEQSFKDGAVGWISTIFESFDTFIIYARLWELQHYGKTSRYL
ncbi:MAG: glycosyltransferase family 2 protein [Patescibacteria group bacterium]